jgi:hypothetical protein
MSLRAIAVFVLAVALMLGQLLPGLAVDHRISSPAGTVAAILTRSVSAQDNDDNDNGDDADDDDVDDDLAFARMT